MGTLVVARGQQQIDAVLAVLRDDGFDATGTTDDEWAHAQLAAGDVTTLIIGGGVEQVSREALRQAARLRDATVVEGALAGRDVETYVRQELEPRLPSPDLR